MKQSLPWSFVPVQVFLAVFLFFISTAHSQEWTYTVQPGDNLWDLGKKYLVSMRYWQEFQGLNQVADPRNIPPGTHLRFPLQWLKSGASIATVSHVYGRAEIVEGGTGLVRTAQQGMFLWGKAEINTAEDSSVTLTFPDKSQILIQSNSSFKLDEIIHYYGTGMAEIKTRLEKGRVHNKVRPKSGPGSRFEISTPSAVVAVRGTEYRTSATAVQGDSRVEVLKGDVAVKDAVATGEVPAGFGTVTFVDSASLPPVKLLPSPDASELKSLYIRPQFSLNVPPIPGAVMYRLQIAPDGQFDTLLYDRVFSSNRIWGHDLPDGDYVLRVHGIDDNGLEGLDAVHAFTLDAQPFPPSRIQPAPDAVFADPRPQFMWSEPQDVSEYWFQLAEDENFEGILIDLPQLAETTLQFDHPVEPGLYFWRVATRDGEGNLGPFSDSQSFRITPPAPDMKDAQLNKKEMAFRWSKGENVQQYRVQASLDDTFTDIVVDEKVADPEYSLKQLQPGPYFIRVSVIDIDGIEGPFSPYQKIELPFPPQPVLYGVLTTIALLLIIL